MDEPPAPPDNSPVASHTRSEKLQEVIQAPLHEAVGPDRGILRVKAPFSTMDLEVWEKIAKDCRSDPVGITKHFQFIVKQHHPDWNDIQLLLDHLTETKT